MFIALSVVLERMRFERQTDRHTERPHYSVVEEFTDYDSVVVFSAVGHAYIAKFFVTSH